jgi:hypothetical protein
MARMTKDQYLANLHAEALREFDDIQSALRDERLQCLQDRRFYSIAGAQWEGPIGQQFENKPKFEVNKIMLAVMRIISEYRNNRTTVDFVSKDGTKDNKLADVCDGLFRADEIDSVAEEAYDNAFEEAVAGGFGAFRLRTEWEDEYDEDNDRQRIRIEPIFDADSSVFFDLNAKRQDKSDATRCFVITAVTRAAYEAEWGDDPASWPKEVYQTEFDWLTPDVVYIAEYYRVEDVRETVRIFQNLDGTEERYMERDFEADPELETTLAAIGSVEVRQKKVKRRKVRKYIMNGARIIEDLGYIAGKCIPVIPVYGKRWFIDNVERCMGHVRLAKDAQRLANMQRSKLGEIAALSSIEKPIFLPEQVAGHQLMWSEDNLKNYPYLLLNPVTDQNGNSAPTGPVGYTKPPVVPPAMEALLTVTEKDMQDVLGNQQQADKMVSNISGKAVELIQQRVDMQSFIYISNWSKAVKRCGEVWLEMARDVYVEKGRKMKTVGGQDEVDSVELMRPVLGENGEVETENDLSAATFDVNVDVGPSSSSKRQATVRALMGMIQITQDPEIAQVLQSMAIMNMEGEGISDVRDFFRERLLRLGVVKPTQEEAMRLMEEQMQAQQAQDPNAIFLQAAAEEAIAKAARARADTVRTVADSELIRAKTVETLAKVDLDTTKQALETAQTVNDLARTATQAPVSLPTQPLQLQQPPMGME